MKMQLIFARLHPQGYFLSAFSARRRRQLARVLHSLADCGEIVMSRTGRNENWVPYKPTKRKESAELKSDRSKPAPHSNGFAAQIRLQRLLLQAKRRNRQPVCQVSRAGCLRSTSCRRQGCPLLGDGGGCERRLALNYGCPNGARRGPSQVKQAAHISCS
jgi:hypothetical protein